VPCGDRGGTCAPGMPADRPKTPAQPWLGRQPARAPSGVSGVGVGLEQGTHLGLAGLAQLVGQLEGDRGEGGLFGDPVKQRQPDLAGHFRIVEGAVEGACGLDVQMPDQRLEPVVLRILEHSSGQQHRAVEASGVGSRDPGELGIQELAVEGGVVGDQVVVADELVELFHHLVARGRALEHGVGDARVLGDEIADRKAGVHELLEAFDEDPVDDLDGPDLDGAVPAVRRQAGRLEVQHHKGVSMAAWSGPRHAACSRKITSEPVPPLPPTGRDR